MANGRPDFGGRPEKRTGRDAPVLGRVPLSVPGVSVVETMSSDGCCVRQELHPRGIGQAHPPWLGQVPSAIG